VAAQTAQKNHSDSDTALKASDHVRQLLFIRPNVRAQFAAAGARFQPNRSRIVTHPGVTLASNPQRRFRPFVITNDNWKGGAGNWSNAAKWSAGVPTSNNNVFIDNGLATASPVALDISGAANNLTISSGDSLNFNNNTVLTVGGTTISNAGAITLNSAGNATELIIGSSGVTLSGAGTMTLSNNSQNFIFGSAGTNVLTNQSTIQGSGNIGDNQMGLVNSGTINANQSTPLLLQLSSGTTNTGTLEATNGGSLILVGGTFTNTGGTIKAVGANSAVSLENGASITGGTITDSSGGIVQSPSGHNVTLSGVTNTGTYAIQNNSITQFVGTTTNSGTIQLNSAGNGTDFELNGNVTLTGGGTVSLTNNSQNFFLGTAGANRLTNVNNTIQGSGNIGENQMGLTNKSTINANQSTPLIIQTSTGTTNTGTLEATNGASLILLGDTYTNTGGTIKAVGSGSTVSLENSLTINGGTLTTSTGGVNQVPGGQSVTLNGITNAGTLAIQNNSTAILANTITNNSALQLNSVGNGTQLRISNASNAILAGTGTLTLSDNGQNFILGQTTGAEQFTNKQTIQGPAGNIGDDFLTIINQGTINATKSASGNSLILQPGSGGLTNSKTLEATGGGSLILYGGTFTETGVGAILATGTNSVVSLENSVTINGGPLTASGGGLIQVPSGLAATLNGVTLSGPYAIQNNSTTTVSGTLTNKGTVQLNSAGNGTELRLNGNVTLTGGGTVNLSNNTQNFIFALTAADLLTNVNNTIQGSGNVGDGQMALNNQSVINANQSTALNIQTSNGMTNSGTLEATNGGTLVLIGDTYSNGGTIKAVGASTVDLQSTTINGGTLTTSGGGLIQVPSGISSTISGLTNSGTLAVQNNSTLTLAGTINNTGAIQMNSAGNSTQLRLGGNVSLTGSGTVTLSNNSQNFLFGNSGTDVLTNVNNTISGAGNIGDGQMGLNNQSVINANQSTPLIIQTSNGTTNTGTLEATGGGALALIGNAFTNTGGTIQAVGTGSTVDLESGVTVTGGTLTTSGGGLIQTPSGLTATLSGITNKGTLAFQNNTTDVLSGTITNNGAMQLNSGGNGTQIRLSGNVTLNGTGTLSLSNNSQNFILGNSTSTEVLTNASTIQGSGNIGDNFMGLVNNGTILANQSTELFIQPDSTGFTNNGTLSVNSGSILDIETGPFANFNSGNSTLTGGTYIVGGTLQFDNAHIVTNAAHISLTSPTATIVNQSSVNALSSFATNAAGGSFSISGGANFTTAGNFTNSGSLSVGAGDTFKVTGSLTNFANHTLTGGTYNIAGTLQFGAAGSTITTNAANLTLRGASAKLLSLTGGNLLAPLATNASTGVFTVAGGGSFTTAAAFTNNGTLDVESGSTLAVTGNLTNTGTAGTNLTNQGGAANTLTVTGKLTSTAGSVTIGANNDTTDVANVGTFANSAPLTVGTGATLNLTAGGTDTNTSTISLNGATLKLTGTSVTLSGAGGIVNLSNSASNLITASKTGLTLTNSETIRGSGTISNLGITNGVGGVLLANQATPLIILPSTTGLTNNGTLTVNTGDTMKIGTSSGGALKNFSGTTLTGGTYNVSGTLQFGASGTKIVTNAANITLTGTGSKIIDFGSANVLAGFTTNAAAGKFTLAGNQSLTTTGGSFTNAGTFTVSTGSTFKVGGSSFLFTQTGGTSTIDGTLTSSTLSTFNLNGGSLFGGGAVNYSLVDGASITPGDSAAKTAILNVKQAYTQNASGALNISIGGTTVGTQFDQLNVTKAAALGGTLNISLINGFVPAIGAKFDILNGSAVSGNFATIHGLSINASEHFTETVNATNVTLTVVSGAAPVAATSLISPSGQRRINFGLVAPHRYSTAVVRPPAAKPVAAAPVPHLTHMGKRFGMMDAAGPPLVAPALMSGYSAAPGYASFQASTPSAPNMGIPQGHRHVELVIDVNSLRQTSPKRLLKGFFADPDSPDAVSIGYLTSTSGH
jgi:hypothetical protein